MASQQKCESVMMSVLLALAIRVESTRFRSRSMKMVECRGDIRLPDMCAIDAVLMLT